MPFAEVMGKFKRGALHSGGKEGPKVTDRKQAMAIMMNEKQKARSGKEEYMDPKMMKVHTSARMKKHDRSMKKGPKRGFASLG